MSISALFAFANDAEDRGDSQTTKTTYRALASNPDLELRTKSRFCLALMVAGQIRNSDAAVLLRQILDEKPDVARVRLELSRILAVMSEISIMSCTVIHMSGTSPRSAHMASVGKTRLFGFDLSRFPVCDGAERG